MAKLIVMYKTPADAAAFDRHYFGRHVPIAKKVAGLKSYEVSRGPIVTLEGLAPYHLIAVLTFDSVNAIQAGLASEEGKATAADLVNFASDGVDIFIIDTITV